jgi:glycosyltransferase involved in cell wall biosynthesis
MRHGTGPTHSQPRRADSRRSGPRSAAHAGNPAESDDSLGGNGRPNRGPVLLLSPQPFYEDRGTPIAVRQVLEALGQLGYRVDVATYPMGRSLQLPGVRYFRAANPFGIRRVSIGLSTRKLVLDACLIPTVWKRLRTKRYHAIHAVEEGAFPAVELGRRYGVPVIYDMQSSLPEQLSSHPLLNWRAAQGLLRRAERWLLRRVDFVVTSAGLAQRVARVAPEARVREWRFAGTAPSAPSHEVESLRRSLAIPAGVPVVVYSGTFAAYQGLPDLVAAIPAVLRELPEAVFVLVGADGLEGERLARRTGELMRTGKLHLVERQRRERVPAYLAMADVLVSPRAYGGNLPLKIFDYLAAGKPIVATDVPAHRAVLDSGRAELVEPSADALARAIVRVLRDPAWASRLAEEAGAYSRAKLGWIAFVRSVAELYEEVEALTDPGRLPVEPAAAYLDATGAGRSSA